MSQEDDITFGRQDHSAYWYDRRLYSGEVAEAGAQTFSDTVVSLFPFPKSDKNIKIFGSTRNNYPITYKYPPEFPVWAGFLTRKVASSPGLLFNSFNFDSTGIVICCCQKFEVDPALVSVTFEDLGGVEELKRSVVHQVILPFASASGHKSVVDGNQLLSFKLDIPKGVLFIGDEGTGKTSIIHAIVNELRTLVPSAEVKFYKVDGAHCFGSFVGTGATFRDLFHFALDKSPLAVILFENIEQLFDRSISLFLSELNSAPRGRLLVFATTTKKEQLHERLFSVDEPGKFDFSFELHLPDFWERVAMLQIHFQRRQCSVEDRDINELASATCSYTAGELEKLVMNINAKAVEGYNISYKLDGEPGALRKRNPRQPCISPSREKITGKLVFKEFERYNVRRKVRKLKPHAKNKSCDDDPNFCEVSSRSLMNLAAGLMADVDEDNMVEEE